MTDASDLNSMLEGDEPVETQPEPQHAAPEQVETQPEPTGEDTTAAPPADIPQQQSAPEGDAFKKAALDERKKRQELERRLSEYEERLKRYEQQPSREEPKEPDWYEAPDRAAEALQERVQREIYQTRVALSEQFLRQQHQDYDEVSSLFAEQAQRDPHLLQQLFAHPMPAQFAYQIGQQIKLMQDVGNDPAAYRKKLEDEIRAQILAEQGGTQKTTPDPANAPQVPRSLARDVSQQPRNGRGQFDGPVPIDELLG